MSKEDLPPETVEDDFCSAGDALAASRLKQKMSLDQVAERLKIPIHYLKALEKSAYHELPQRAFVRGYLRNYARLVGADEASILNLYDQLNHTVVEANRLTSGRQPRRKALFPWSIVLGLLITLGFVIFSVYWWYSHCEDLSALSSDFFSSSERIDSNVFVPPPVDEPESPHQDVFDSGGQSPFVFSEQSTGVAGGEYGNLKAQFTGECWVEVKDCHDATLFSGIKSEQSALVLSGRLPLSVTLGNVEAVSHLSLNGKSVELARALSDRHVSHLQLN